MDSIERLLRPIAEEWGIRWSTVVELGNKHSRDKLPRSRWRKMRTEYHRRRK